MNYDPDPTLEDLDIYQQQVVAYSYYPNAGQNLPYTLIALGGESGEMLNDLKKTMRDQAFDRDKYIEELGDVQFYVAAAARELGVPLSLVAQRNLDKIQGRASEGQATG